MARLDIYRGSIYSSIMVSRPISEAVFFVLLSLLDEPRHGYGIKQATAELSEQRVDLRVGTLYGVLDRLSGDGLVEHDHDEVQQGRLRRYYRLTESGKQALRAESARMSANVRAAEPRLTEPRPGDAAGRARPAGAG